MDVLWKSSWKYSEAATGGVFNKRLQHRCFPVSIARFFRTPILKNIFERLFLIIVERYYVYHQESVALFFCLFWITYIIFSLLGLVLLPQWLAIIFLLLHVMISVMSTLNMAQTLTVKIIRLSNWYLIFLGLDLTCEFVEQIYSEIFFHLDQLLWTSNENDDYDKRFLAIIAWQNTAQKMKFFIKDFFSKCDQIRNFLRIWSHLLRKSLMENFIFCGLKPHLASILDRNSAKGFYYLEPQNLSSYPLE